MTSRPIVASVIFALLCVVVILANKKWHFDPDAGGYKRSFKNSAGYRKGLVHGLAALGILLLAVILFVPWYVASAILVVAMVGFEWSQGFINQYDLLGGTIGMLIALAALYVRHVYG